MGLIVAQNGNISAGNPPLPAPPSLLSIGSLSQFQITDLGKIVGYGGSPPGLNQILYGNNTGSFDAVTLASGTGISILRSGNTVTIKTASTIPSGGGITNTVAIWLDSTTLSADALLAYDPGPHILTVQTLQLTGKITQYNGIAPLNGQLLIGGTASGNFSAATLTETTNRISVMNGNNSITLDISSSYIGQTSITTLGTVTTGTWSGSVITETFGGTGQNSYILGDTLYASTTNTLAKLAGNITTTRKFLRQVGTGFVSAAPAWDTLVNGDIPTVLTGHTYNGLTLTSNAVGFTISGGTTVKTLIVDADLTVSELLTMISVFVETGTFTGLTVANGTTEVTVKTLDNPTYGTGFVRAFKFDVQDFLNNGYTSSDLTIRVYEKVDGSTYRLRSDDGISFTSSQNDLVPSVIEVSDVSFSQDLKITAQLNHAPAFDLSIPFRIELFKNQTL